MSAPDYLLIGHLTADLTPDGRTPGGTVTYAAHTAHAFGLNVGVLTSAASDEPLLDALRPVAEVVCIPAAHTTTFENLYTSTGRVQYIRQVATPLTPAHLPAAWRGAPLVHLAPIADEVAPEFAAYFDAATVIVTLQGWLRRWDSAGRVHFKRWHDAEVLRCLAAVILSSEDLHDAPDLEAALAHDAPHLFMTQAEQGGVQYTHGQPTRYSTPQVEVVNPTGAGDVFAAALL
ncbi:MAG: ribokinase, partial [Armatimonadetes bacterium]|nr:ribokinase [Anaerolineae bacterium]